ncbi:MAG: phosphoribosylamine--glycine ligase [Betaproteobacteria bacterium]|nr:phosphoribosylamine--glycine ligase [Betaproteobacteria bacterium]
MNNKPPDRALKILVVGGGGREHALAWRLLQSPQVQTVFVAPGNGGTAREPGIINVPIDGTTPDGIIALAELVQAQGIALTVVGPEGPLAAGIVDAFRTRGLRIFGPSAAAAQLESSKDFAKAFMTRHAIPTAAYGSFTVAEEAHAYVDRHGAPIVIKADGLAAGKGVVVAQSLDEAHEAIDQMLVGNRLGGAEASFIVMADGTHVLALASSQDHKRLRDGDQGPNTGGMGAYSPAPVVTPAVHQRVLREIILPAIRGMAADGIPYTGFLYAGLMIDPDGGVKTLEFNCRLGDPETQPILARLQSDLVELLEAAIDGRLDQVQAQWDPQVALGVVLAAAGYPEAPRKGDPIHGLPVRGNTLAPNVMAFHAGTQSDQDQLRTSGGRVLCVTALGETVRQASERAYAAIDQIDFAGLQMRRDIGHRALEPLHPLT